MDSPTRLSGSQYPFSSAKLGINPIPCKRLLSGLMVTVWWNCMDADSLYIDFNTH